MLAPVTHTATTDAQTPTLQAVSPTALRCACSEFATNGFCAHLVYYGVAKIQAHRKGVILSHEIAEQ